MNEVERLHELNDGEEMGGMRKNKGNGILVLASGRIEGTWANWPESGSIVCSCSVDGPAPWSELVVMDCRGYRGCKSWNGRTEAFDEDNDDDEAGTWEDSE